MKNIAVKYGLFMGVSMAILYILLYVVNKDLFLSVPLTMFIGTVLPILFMYRAIKDQRELDEGFISFADALKVSFLVYVIGSILPKATQTIIMNMDPELVEALKDKALALTERVMDFTNAPDADRQQVLQDAASQNFTPDFKSTMLDYAIALIFPGFIISLILSAILKRDNS